MSDAFDLHWLTTPVAAEVLADVAVDARPLHQRLDALRKSLGAARAKLVLELAESRQKGREKFGPLADRLFGTPVQWEQATDAWIAAYKAQRFTDANASVIQDFCCGMGGDLLALAPSGEVTGWDLSEAATIFAAANLETLGRTASICAGDVETALPEPQGAWHVDPDRHVGGRRSTTPELHAPTPATIDRWLALCERGAVKLAPATQPWGEWAAAAEWEWVSRERECRQLVAWFGGLRRAGSGRRATRVTPVTNGSEPFLFEAETFAGSPEQAQAADNPQGFVVEPDPALIAADLVGAFANAHGLSTLGAGSVYLTGDAPLNTSLAASFAVTAVLPLRPAGVAQHMASAGVGEVEIKVRGVSQAPDAFRRALKLRGDRAATLFLTRIGRREVAIVAERL